MSRGRALLIFLALFVFVMVVAVVLAWTAATNAQINDLDRRVTHLETDVSSLRE